MISNLKIILLSLFFLISCSDQNQSNETLDSDQGLSQEHSYEFRKEVIEVTDDIYVGVGYGLANSIMIETEKNLIIVDTLGSVETATELIKDFRKISEKPIIAIIYTHNHLDHLGGAKVFFDEEYTEIYAQENIIYNLDNIATTIRPIIFERSSRQFGIPLPEEEIVHQGIGGFLEINDQSTFGLVRPNILFDDQMTLKIDDLTLMLAHVPGETDDHLYVWIPEKKVVMVGDNFYRSFANLYAIRGTKFRNPMEWVHSLDKIRLLNAEHLVPSHSRPISGEENVSKALTDYRDGIQFVHDQTIRYINKGLTPNEIVQKVKLPNHLAESPYLQPFYGSISSYIRSIFSGYIGWFSGNISDLHPLSATERAQKFVNIARKQTKISDEAESALTNGEYQWALELADILLALDPDSTNAKNIKANAAEKLSQYQLASNDYYFYRTVAGELRNEINVDPSTANSVTPEQLEATPMDAIMNILPVNLNSEKSEEIIKTYQFSFTDSEENYSVYVRRGVAQISKYPEPNAEIKVITDQQTLKEVFGGLKNLSAISLLLANNTINVEGSKLEFLQFLDLFTD
jgi:alkyl sulfatase BDS1-like metallo-beta-lactamase superfamily hydrolase|tara:strand:+ start:388 stop:2109 length:1722 start_codon:yes stop_codon:yes gene_type:complete